MMTTLSGIEYEALFDDVNNRMASSRLSKRHSRGSGIQTPNRNSARIEKPRSTNPSPRRLERRKTTASVKPYVSLDDHYNAMLGPGKTYDDASDYTSARLQSDYSLARPMSWHPTSFQRSRPATTIKGEIPLHVHGAGFATSHNSTPSAAGKVPASLIRSPPLLKRSETTSHLVSSKDDTYNVFGSQPQAASQLARATWCISPDNFNQVPHAQACIPPGLESLYSSTTFLPPQPSNDFEIPTAQQTMEEKQVSNIDFQTEPDDFLPMQRPASRIASNPASGNIGSSLDILDDEEHMIQPPRSADHSQHDLVGMGLYDPPESDMSIIRTGLPQEAKGRGLKLEETWNPPRSLLLSKDHSEDDDASSDSGSNISNGVGTGNNEVDEDFIMGGDISMLTVSDQDEVFLPEQQPSSAVLPIFPTVSGDLMNMPSVAKAPISATTIATAASAGIIPAPNTVHMPLLAAAPAPPSLAGRSFFFDEEEDSMVSRGMDMWYSQLRPATQTSMLGTTWF